MAIISCCSYCQPWQSSITVQSFLWRTEWFFFLLGLKFHRFGTEHHSIEISFHWSFHFFFLFEGFESFLLKFFFFFACRLFLFWYCWVDVCSLRSAIVIAMLLENNSSFYLKCEGLLSDYLQKTLSAILPMGWNLLSHTGSCIWSQDIFVFYPWADAEKSLLKYIVY